MSMADATTNTTAPVIRLTDIHKTLLALLGASIDIVKTRSWNCKGRTTRSDYQL